MKRTHEKNQKTLIAVLALLIATILISFIMVRLKAVSDTVTQEVIETLMAENEDNPETVKYLVTDNCISRVYPETEVETFVTNFSEGEVVKVYSDKACTQEVTDGFVMSGMYAKYDENDRIFEISVLGDINEKESKTDENNVLLGDGVLNQIELTRDIRQAVEDENWQITDEAEKKSADVNCNNQIDERAVKTIADYIVFGDLNIPEVELVQKPTIEVTQGNLNANTTYTSDVVLKIRENEENALKTIYKITGDKEQEYKTALDAEEVVLNENGIYKITAYTYGELENKSKREYVIININKTANYTVEYYLEGLNGEYTKVEEDTKTLDGVIGKTVEIEHKQYTDYELDVDNSNGKLTGEVLEDGSLVLKAYYERKSFTYTLKIGENIESVSIQKTGEEIKTGETVTITGKWGETISIDAIVEQEDGYEIVWDNWKNTNNNEDIIKDQNTTITIQKGNIEYEATAIRTVIDYSITYNLNEGELPENITNPTNYNVETSAFALNNPSKQGYIFQGWTGGVVDANGEIDDNAKTGTTGNIKDATTTLTIESGSIGNRKYTANWKAVENTPYTIKHYKETLQSGEFILAETETKEGTTDTEVTAVSKEYLGFTFDENNEKNILNGTITADGKLELELYYTRNIYDLTIAVGDNISSVSAEGEELTNDTQTTKGEQSTTTTETLKYKYEQKVTIDAILDKVVGYEYTWDKWESSDDSLISNILEQSKQIVMPAGNITLIAEASRTATIYNITYELNGGTLPQGVENPSTYTVESSDLTINNLQDGTKLGYNFAGWTGSNGNTPSKNVVLKSGSTGDKTYTANWEGDSKTAYIVKHYKENLDGTYDITDTENLEGTTDTTVIAVKKSYNGYSFDDTNEKNVLEGTVAADGSLVLSVYYNRNEYTLRLIAGSNIESVSFSSDLEESSDVVQGTDIQAKFKFGTQIKISSILVQETGYLIQWNTWESNNSEILVNQALQNATIGMPIGDITLTAKASKKVNTYKYKIQYYYDGKIDETKTEEKSATFGSNISSYTNKNITGYELDKEENKPLTVTENEADNVMKVYYKQVEYTINYNLDGGNLIDGKTNPTTYTVNSENITLNNPEKPGYTFLGWTGTNGTEAQINVVIEKGSTGNREYTANWRANTDTEYMVEHYKENLDGTYSIVNEDTENLFGTTGQTVTATPKEYVGFTYDENNENGIKSDVVTGEEKLVLKLYYTRNSYQLTVKSGENIENVSIGENETGTELTKDVKYEEIVSISAILKTEENYDITWSKWESANTSLIGNQSSQISQIIMPAGNIELTAKANKVGKKYNYTVEYYYDNVIDSTKTDTKTAEYNTQVTTYSNKVITGYEFDKVENTPLTITSNVDENVIKVYYKIINYTITYNLNDGLLSENTTNPETYNVNSENIILNNPEKVGYNFLGWTGGVVNENGEIDNNAQTGTTGNIEDATTTLTIQKGSIGNRKYTANWRASTDTVYKVEHYIENIETDDSAEDVNNYTLYKTDGEDGSLVGTTGETATATPITITGFTYDTEKSSNTISGAILADGSLVLKIFYSRNSYKLNLVVGDENIGTVINGGESSTTSIEKTYKYEQSVEIAATLGKVEGYNTSWKNWTSSDTSLISTISSANITIKIPAGDVTLTANGTKQKANFAYSVEYYYDGIEDEEQKETGKTAEFESQIISYTEKLKDGYEFDKVENLPLTITANAENNVIKVYYKLKDYTITYDLQEGSLEDGITNPSTYNLKSEDILLNNPIRENYIFIGWTGGVVNENGEIDSEAKTGTSENVTNPTKNLTIQTGSLGNRKYTANWEERAYEVIVHHYLAETGPGYSNDAVMVAEDEILTSKVLGESYQTDDLIPTYDADGNIVETDEREYLDGKEFYVTGNYGNVTGVYTKDTIEVIYYYQYYPVVRIVSSPESSLEGTEYITIEAALHALEDAGLTVESETSKLQLLRNVKNEAVSVENQNVQIELDSFEINSKSETEPTITLDNSKLIVTDESDYSLGKIISENTTGVYIKTNSEFTLGVDEKPVYQSPEIIGNTKGVEKETVDGTQGVFNFFDGKITATTAIDGTVDLAPLLYNATVTVSDDGKQISTLAVVSNVEARIGRKTYLQIEDAIAEANTIYGTDGSQVEIVVVKDISKEQPIVVDETKNIKLDLAGYTITTTASDYVLENSGDLEIIDSTATEENPYGNGKITSTTYNTILNSYSAGELVEKYTSVDLLSTSAYKFVEEDGKFVSNNTNLNNSVANSYIIIDLEDKTGEYLLGINAEISSESGCDIGYATVTTSKSIPAYNTTTGRFMYISGETEVTNYSGTLCGGTKYYLHLGYRKDGSKNTGDDQFIINNINLYEKDSANLTLTSGSVKLETAGTSSSDKCVIQNSGNLYIGEAGVATLAETETTTESAIKPYLYSSAKYTRLVGGTGDVVVNKGLLETASVSDAKGVCIAGNLIINGGVFNTYIKSVQLGSDSPAGNKSYINGGTFSAEIYNYSMNELEINGGTFNDYVYNYNDTTTGKMIINDGTFNSVVSNRASANVEINGGIFNNQINNGNGSGYTSTMTINDGTFNSGIVHYTSAAGILTINDGNFYASINNSYAGTINIYGGTIVNDGHAIYNSSSYAITNIYNADITTTDKNYEAIHNRYGTTNIYGGNITSNTYTVYNYDSGSAVNIYGGNISTTSTSKACVYNNSTGTITIGNNDGEIKTDSPMISGVKSYGVQNQKGTFNFYDGTIKGKVDQSINGQVNAIADDSEILFSYEGDSSEIEVATLGVPTNPVAQIGETTYTTLQAAIDACPTSNSETPTTITIIDDFMVSTTSTVSDGQNIIIDLNNKHIESYSTSPIIENNGNLEIVDNLESTTETISENAGSFTSTGGGIIVNNSNLNLGNIAINMYGIGTSTSDQKIVVSNTGTLEVNNTTMQKGTNSFVIYINNTDSGKLTVNSGNLTGVNGTTGIYNSSSEELVINNVYINTNVGVYNTNGGTVTVKDGNIIGNYIRNYIGSAGIRNINGNVTVDGGQFKGSSTNGIYTEIGNVIINNAEFTGETGIYIDDDSEVVINNGNFNTQYNVFWNSSNLKGKATINDGTFTATSANIYNYSEVEINGGEFTSSGYCIGNLKSTAVVTIKNANMTAKSNYGITNSGTINFISGTLKNEATSTSYKVIQNNSGATLTLGEDDGEVSQEQPSLIGNAYGVYNQGTFNFYDGIIEAATDKSIYGTVNDQADGYEIIKRAKADDSTKEIAILDLLPIAKVVSTGVEYLSIQDAVDACADNTSEEIDILRNAIISENVESAEIPENKNIVLDLNGYSITAGNMDTFVNNGNLEIIDSSEGTTGVLSNTSYGLFNNQGVGNITFTSGNILTTAETYTIDDTEYNCYVATNNGTGDIVVNGATINGEYGLKNVSTGGITVLSGVLDISYTAITNSGDGDVLVKDGNIEGDAGQGIYNETGNVTVDGGIITGRYGINNNSTGNIEINGGTITADYEYTVIYMNNGTVTINDGKIGKNVYYVGVRLRNNSEAIINGGTFNVLGTIIYVYSDTAKATINGGTFTTTNTTWINNNGTLEITGGTFTSTSTTASTEYPAIYNQNIATISNCEINTSASCGIVNSGTLTMLSGTMNITNKSSIGISSEDKNAVLTLGNDDGTVNNDKLIINATVTGVEHSGTNNILNYYDGTITAQQPIIGEVNTIADGYSIIPTTLEDSRIQVTLGQNSGILQIGNTTYNTLQEAINACPSDSDSSTTITVLKPFWISDEEITTVEAGKDVILDLSGYTIQNYGTMFNNKGKLQITDSSSERTGIITGYSTNLIENTGNLVIDCNVTQYQNNKFIINSEQGTVKVLGGNININDNSNYYENIVIYNTSSGDINIAGGNIAATYSNDTNDTYVIKNIGTSDINVTDGTITVDTLKNGEAYIIYTNNTDSENVNKITISGGYLTREGIYEAYGVYVAANGNVEVSGGTIDVGTGIYNKMETVVTGGTIIGKYNGIYNNGINNSNATVKISGGEIKCSYTANVTYYGAIENVAGILEITDGTISAASTPGIINTNDGTVSITGGTITDSYIGIYAGAGTVNMTGGQIDISNNTNSLYGVQIVSSGIFNLGVEEYPVSEKAPSISSSQYGVYKDSTNAKFNFYDGKITGSTKAIYGEVNNTPELYTVQISEDETVATLGITATFEQVASMNGIYYNSLQQAINAAGTTASTIKLEKDIILTEGLTIAENQNITIDLYGYSIVTPDVEYTIVNNGTLIIIDTLLMEDSTEAVSRIENLTGIAIHNNGTLTLGVLDGTVYTNIPSIIGVQYGIENNGTLNIFDGTIKGVTEPIGGVETIITVPEGYVYEVVEETVDEVVRRVFTLKASE